MGIFTKIFGTASDRILKNLKPIVEHINSLESGLQALTDAEVRQQRSDNILTSSEKGLLPEKRWMTFCRRLLPSPERQVEGCY